MVNKSRCPSTGESGESIHEVAFQGALRPFGHRKIRKMGMLAQRQNSVKTREMTDGVWKYYMAYVSHYTSYRFC